MLVRFMMADRASYRSACYAVMTCHVARDAADYGEAPACSRSRFSGWISGWRGGALYPLAVAADRRGRFSNNSKQADCYDQRPLLTFV